MKSDIQPTDSKSDSPDLEEVRQRFESWRQKRKKRTRIPKSLWQAAAGLTSEYSINHLSKVLRVNYSALKNQVHKLSLPEPSKTYVSSTAFLELPIQTPSLESTIEMIRADGAAMTMRLKGATGSDLLELGKAFWKYGA